MASSMAFRGGSSSSTRQWTYDVYLSFSGTDTRRNFSAHLYDALERKGIHTFIDDETLEGGNNISTTFVNAIEKSRISIIVLSRNYASSTWCLDELTKILECKETKGQIVLPVFYYVDRLDVRHQRNSFGKAFVQHEQRFKDNPEKVQRWKAALTQVTNLSGWHVGDYGKETQLIGQIVQGIANHTFLQVAKHPIGPVGIESPVQVPDLSSSVSPVGIESPVQVPNLSSSLSPVGIKSPVQVPDLSGSPSPVGTESLVQVPNLSSSPSRNGEQGSNPSILNQGAILFLITSVIGLFQLNDLFETHPVNMWISEAALIIFCLSHATMKKINETRWARHSQIIDSFRVLSGTLVPVSLSSIHLPHRLWWLFFVIWTLLAFIVACSRIYLVVEEWGVERGQTPPLAPPNISLTPVENCPNALAVHS